MILLRVDKLTKSCKQATSLLSFEKFNIVDNISFTLERQQTLAIIGKNGSGKSTLAKMIVGIVEPSSGKIVFQGKVLKFADYAYRALHIRMVFQEINSVFNSRLNVGQVLDMPLKLTTTLNEQQRNKKIFEALNLVGLQPEHSCEKIKYLSISQKQRVALARALILRPEIIVLDDVFGSLDVSVRNQLLNLMLELQASFGISYIYVGQHLGLIKHIADKVLVMNEGKMVEYGNTRDLFSQPQTDITKRLVEGHFGHLLDESSWREKLKGQFF